MSNGNSDITKSTTHDGIQWTWNKRCDFQILFDKAHRDYDSYVLSERYRWTALLIDDVMTRLKVTEYARQLSPYNYPVWTHLIALSKSISSPHKMTRTYTTSDTAVRELISSTAVVSASVEEGMNNVIDGTSSEWYCRDEEGWVESGECVIFSASPSNGGV